MPYAMIEVQEVRDGNVFRWVGDGNIALVSSEFLGEFAGWIADGALPWTILLLERIDEDTWQVTRTAPEFEG